MNIIITDFKTVKMSLGINQAQTSKMICWLMAKAQAIKDNMSDDAANEYYGSLKKVYERYALSSKYIKQRHLKVFSDFDAEVPDTLKQDGQFIEVNFDLNTNHDLIINNNKPEGLYIQDRMGIYEETVLEAMDKLYSDLTLPNDIVHVTCAAYLAPNPIQTWLAKNQQFNTVVTTSYHMGCYAAIPSIRTAAGLLSNKALVDKRKVDVVHTEYLSIHFDLLGENIDNIISMTLFADGFIKYSLVPETEIPCKGFRIITMHEALIPDSLEDMKWITGSHHFFMTLSAQVPYVLQKHIVSFVQKILSQLPGSYNKDLDSWYFALHPGGPKIIDFVQEELKLSDLHFKYSRKVLLENGNMSSATVPHILQMMLEDDAIPSGAMILSMAFGPGLIATGMILQKI